MSTANCVLLEAAGTLNTLTCSNIYELMPRFFFLFGAHGVKMENCYLQVCDTKNGQCDVTWKSVVADVISDHLVNTRVAVFLYKSDLNLL